MDIGYCIIPPHILADEELSANEKIIYGRVQGLTKEKGYCFASNTWLAEHVGLSKGTVSNIISKLSDKGYLRRETIRDKNKRIIERRLYPQYKWEKIREYIKEYYSNY